MTRFLTFICALFLTVSAEAATIGETAPAFTAPTATGETVSLSDFKGQPVVLEWGNFECPFVRKHYDSGNMQKLQRKYTEKGVVWLTIFSSAEGKQGHYTQEELLAKVVDNSNEATYAIMDPEGKIGEMYNAKVTPHMFVINKEGQLVYDGAIDSIRSTDIADVKKAENYVVAALEALEHDHAVTTAKTSPYGCSVKY